MTKRTPQQTLDLFTWEPKPVTQSFAREITRAVDLRALVAKSVAAGLKESDKSRDQIAADITAYLGEEVTCNMLDAYASAARENHVISLIRFIGLLHATRDIRLLQALADLFDWAVIPARYVPAIEDALLAEKIETLQQRQKMARKSWRAP